MNFLCGFTEPGAQITIPRLICSLSTPRNKIPALSPASPRSSNLRNISTPVTVDTIGFSPSFIIPMISTELPTLITPRSIRPVATVPRPVIENTSSTGIKKGLSFTRTGSRISLSHAAISSSTFTVQAGSPSRAFKAEPLITAILSPSKSYLLSNSRTSISTSSNISSSSTRSTLFMKTTIFGTPTWRANKMCSRVCGIGPSVAATTKIAPSIWAAPVTMFFT